MALRLVEAFVPTERIADATAALSEAAASADHVWSEQLNEGGAVVRGVVGSSGTGPLIDALHHRFSSSPGFRVIVLSLDAVLPRPPASGADSERPELNGTYLAMAALAAVVAAIGMARGNEAAVIGAMVVAPLLGPNMALALGLTLADWRLVRSAVKSNLAGFFVAFATAAALGLGLEADPSIPELASRTRIGIWDLLLALAAGCAGTLAFTAGAPAYLIGVMVAVAILPPTVASALLLGDGHGSEALRALLLVIANVAAVNLAGILTFIAKGIRPRTWWSAERAKRSARIGTGIWLFLLTALALIIVAYDQIER